MGDTFTLFYLCYTTNYACVYYVFGQLITDPNANAQLISTFIVVIHPIIIYCTQSDIFYYLFAFLGHTHTLDAN